MSLPKTLYVIRDDRYVKEWYEGSPRLSDFNGLRDEEVGEYQLVGKERLTISGPGKAQEVKG